jgi:hypothetical protein
MSVIVTFCKAKGIRGSAQNPAVAEARVRETLALNNSTTATITDGEIVLVGNNESAMILAAFGSTPDAAATAETAQTSAGVPIGAGQVMALRPPAGTKINVKALS